VGFVCSSVFDDWRKDYRNAALMQPAGQPVYRVPSRHYVLEPFYTKPLLVLMRKP
jgi:hypothetical protein